jgi:presenilin-like A22 family membrane protease
MKPTVISPETKKNELIIISLCFIVALIFNIVSIIKFETSWKELFTQIHVVLILTVLFYVIILILRILYRVAKRLFRK